MAEVEGNVAGGEGFGEPAPDEHTATSFQAPTQVPDHPVQTNDSSTVPPGTKLADGQVVSSETSDVGTADDPSLVKDRIAAQGFSTPADKQVDSGKPEVELPGQRTNPAAPDSGVTPPAIPTTDSAGAIQVPDHPYKDDPSFHAPAAAQAEYPYNGGSLGAGETAITDEQREAAGQIRMSDHESKA